MSEDAIKEAMPFTPSRMDTVHNADESVSLLIEDDTYSYNFQWYGDDTDERSNYVYVGLINP